MPDQNPFKLARQNLRLTQDELASLAGVTRGYITMLEAGLYNAPSQRVWTVLAQGFQVPDYPSPVANKILQAYHDWQKLERARFGKSARRNIDLFLAEDVETLFWKYSNKVKHPYEIFRAYASQSSALVRHCKDLKIQPTVLQSYEAGGVVLPPLISEALLDCGVELDEQTAIVEKLRNYSHSGERSNSVCVPRLGYATSNGYHR